MSKKIYVEDIFIDYSYNEKMKPIRMTVVRFLVYEKYNTYVTHTINGKILRNGERYTYHKLNRNNLCELYK